MMKMIWKIDIDDIELQKPKYGTGSRVRPLRKHAHDCKNYNFQMKNGDIFLIFTQNIRGGSNEYLRSMFKRKSKKKAYPCNPQFYYIKVEC